MLPFSFTQCESKWFGSHTDLLALLHTAPYCPPGHNRPKCFKSPEWKWGLFFFLTASFKATPGALKAPRSTAPWINEGNLAAGRSTFDPHYSFTQLGPGTRKLSSLWGWLRLGGDYLCACMIVRSPSSKPRRVAQFWIKMTRTKVFPIRPFEKIAHVHSSLGFPLSLLVLFCHSINL